MNRDMIKNQALEELGTFQVKESTIRVTDPCYSKDVWCTNVIENCIPGTWKAKIIKGDTYLTGTRCCVLIAMHESASDQILNPEIKRPYRTKGNWKQMSEVCGVDSGQMSIFAASKYKENDDDFYTACCATSGLLNSRFGGVMEFGVVCIAGYGDGGYDGYYHKTKHGVDAIMVEFL